MPDAFPEIQQEQVLFYCLSLADFFLESKVFNLLPNHLIIMKCFYFFRLKFA